MRAYFEKNKSLILLLDMLVGCIFAFPLLIERVLRKKGVSDPKKILVIELWGIGDLVMMSAVLKPLREKFPDACITLLCKETGKTLFATEAAIDRYICFDFPWTKFKGKYSFWKWDWAGLLKTVIALRREKFELILDARGDIRNNLLSFLIRGKKRIGYSWTGGRYFLTDAVRLKQRSVHRVVAWLNLSSALGIENIEKYVPNITVTIEEEEAAKHFLRGHGINDKELLIGIHPGAQMKSRCWPLTRFAEFAEQIRNKFKAKVITFIEPEGYGEDIPIKGEFIKVRAPLRDMISIIKKLDLLICNDSGAMHIASAVNTRTLSLFGPGEVKMIGPYGHGHTLLFMEKIDCRPCFDYCKFSQPICWHGITVEMAVEAAEKILSERLVNTAL